MLQKYRFLLLLTLVTSLAAQDALDNDNGIIYADQALRMEREKEEVRQRNLAAMIIGKSFRYLDAGITNFITAQVAFPGYQKSVRLCSRHPYKYSENKQISVADTLSKAMQYFKDKDDRMHVRIWMHNMQYLQHDEEIEQYRLRAAYAARVAGFALGMQNANIRQFLLDNNQQVYVDALYESARTTFTENDAQYRRLQPSKE